MCSLAETFVTNYPVLIVFSWIVFFVLFFIFLLSYLHGFFSKPKTFNHQDSIDAARYRYLRTRISPAFLFGVSLEDLDSAIDKSMEAQS